MSLSKFVSYSEALKPISVASQTQAKRFIPLTGSGPYSASNNICRIMLSAPGAFMDLKNLQLVFTLNNGANAAQFLQNVSDVIYRLNIYSNSGALIDSIVNYNLLYSALAISQHDRDFSQGTASILQGMSDNSSKWSISGNASTGLNFYLNGQLVDSLTIGTARTIKIGNFTFATTATAAEIVINGNSLLNGSAGNCWVNGVRFATTATANQFFVDGTLVSLNAVGNPAVLQYSNPVYNGLSSSAVHAPTGTVSTTFYQPSKTYAIPLLSIITNFNVFFPALLTQGLMIEIMFANNPFYSINPAVSAAANWTITGIEALCPVVTYPESVVGGLKNVLGAAGALNLSSMSFLNYQYPYAVGQTSVSVPIAIKARSLKYLMFFFDPTDSDASIPPCARDYPRTDNTVWSWQLRTQGGQLFPQKPVSNQMWSNQAESMLELTRAFNNTTDVRHGSAVSYSNYTLPYNQGGLWHTCVDFEGSQGQEFIESGMDTQNGNLIYLEINGISPAVAGNVQIFACYDASVSILANGDLVMTR
jgi:hypothetical protein